jgi:hypothetical protein
MALREFIKYLLLFITENVPSITTFIPSWGHVHSEQ